MPSSRACPIVVVAPSRSTGPMTVTFTSGNGAPAGSLTVTVNTAVAVDGAAARGRFGGVAGAWVAGAGGVGAGGGVCASANAGAHSMVRIAAVARMFITVFSPESVGKARHCVGGPEKRPRTDGILEAALRANPPIRRYLG